MSFFKKINYAVIIHVSGAILLLNALLMLACTPVSIYFNETSFMGILLAGLLTASVGAIGFYATRKATFEVRRREGYLIVASVWLLMSLFGALPYLFSLPMLADSVKDINHLGMTNFFFESVSGYTTTGASILVDIEIMPKGLLFWRSMTHWIGGMGIIVLAIAILPLLNIGGTQLFSAEAPGINTDKLSPRITDTAKRLWLLYLLLTLAESILLKTAGMSWFDAVNHAMSTLSTGGFSTKNASVAYWQNQALIQYIIIVFMILAGVNFMINFYLFRGQFKKAFSNQEFLAYILLIVVTTLVFAVAIDTDQNVAPQLPDALSRLEYSFREALFSVASVVTTTGFVTIDYTRFTVFISIVFFFLMFVGGCAGSTAGGMKIVRHLILIKYVRNEFQRQLHPNAVLTVQYNNKSVANPIVYNVLAFFLVYLMVYLVGAVVMALLDTANLPTDKAFTSALSVTAATLGNIGPAFANYSPVNNFSNMSDAAKWLSAFLMLLGRLELFTLLILFSPGFWRRSF